MLCPVLVPNISLTPWQQLGCNPGPSFLDRNETFTYQLLKEGLQPSPGPALELSGLRRQGKEGFWTTALAPWPLYLRGHNVLAVCPLGQ